MCLVYLCLNSTRKILLQYRVCTKEALPYLSAGKGEDTFYLTYLIRRIGKICAILFLIHIVDKFSVCLIDFLLVVFYIYISGFNSELMT